MQHTSFHVREGEFREHMGAILDLIDQQNARLAPAFVMIDPFGVKGSPMKLIGRVLNNDKSECLISFMYEPIRRFHKQPEYGPHLDELFGAKSWRDCLKMPEGPSKKQFLHDLFRTQLKRHGAKQVLSFELWKGRRHVYTLYFATNSLKGCDLMKASIWKVDDSGGYAFRSGIAGTPSLFETDTRPLAQQLRGEFGTDWVKVEDFDKFVMSDRTHFHKGHLRRETLRPLERKGEISVLRPQGVKGFPAEKDIKIRFN